MKTILMLLIAVVAASSCCLADTISVKVGYATPCTFSALSVMDGVTNTVTFGAGPGGVEAGKPTASPVVISKAVDSCSIPLTLQAFRGSVVPTVTITLSAPPSASGPAKAAMIITLTNAAVTALSDSDQSGGSLAEKVSLVYEKIEIQDLLDNTILTCDLLENICSSSSGG